jgi:mono/diheme cytochrome c family protein
MMPKLRPRPKRFLLALFATTLLNVSVVGCAQNEFAKKVPDQNVDCRTCHSPNGMPGAKDFSAIYANPKSHHAVGVNYPLGSNAYPKFQVPDGQVGEIAFFDRNSNGRPDVNEIQLYGTSFRVTVECASCHRPHGDPLEASDSPRDAYLRIDNVRSELCLTCHRQ